MTDSNAEESPTGKKRRTHRFLFLTIIFFWASMRRSSASSVERSFPPIPWGLKDDEDSSDTTFDYNDYNNSDDSSSDDDDYEYYLLRRRRRKSQQPLEPNNHNQRPSLWKRLHQLWMEQVGEYLLLAPGRRRSPIQLVSNFRFYPILKVCKPLRHNNNNKVKLHAICTIRENYDWKTQLQCENVGGTGMDLVVDGNAKTMVLSKEWKTSPGMQTAVVSSVAAIIGYAHY